MDYLPSGFPGRALARPGEPAVTGPSIQFLLSPFSEVFSLQQKEPSHLPARQARRLPGFLTSVEARPIIARRLDMPGSGLL
jgi:hypothetical protein